jgi:predicted acyltransferase
MIQPAFSFLVGVAMPYSVGARIARGEPTQKIFVHALWRSLLLVALGVFLRSVGANQTNFTFEDTLTQIGLGYPFLFLLGRKSQRVQWAGLGGILIGYWVAFALYPLPGPEFDWTAAQVSKDWSHHATGLAAHWNKNTNFAWAFDTWFLNLFPRATPYSASSGGYATLSFIPTLGTMTLGLIAGGWLRLPTDPRAKLRQFLIAGAIGLTAAVLVNSIGLCPNVKRIWTPTWVLYSGGLCFFFLAAFYYLTEVRRIRSWAFPLMVIGANSIAAYVIAHIWEGFIMKALATHLGKDIFLVLGAAYSSFLRGLGVLLVFWLILFWMYRRKLFLKI